MAVQKTTDSHPLLEKKYFAVKPWIFKILLMCLSLSFLGYFKAQMYKKNKKETRPTVIVPASRSK